MTMTPDLGRDIDTFCTRCKMVLAHTVTAKVDDVIKRVLCNTCKAEHVFRADPTTKKATKKPRKAVAKKKVSTRAIASQFNTLLDGRDVEDAVKYSPKMSLELASLVMHPTFGVGVVSVIKPGSKAEVVFPEAVRVFIFGR